MAATVTDNLRKNLAKLLVDEISTAADSSQYYIGIGKSDVYNATDTVVSPVRSNREERDHRNNMQSVKKVEAASFVIPRYNWTSGNTYSAYDDASVGIPSNSYYVITDNNEVFICLQQAKNSAGESQTSVNKPEVPAGANNYQPFKTADGYVWKFLYGVSAGKANSFLSANFVPVQIVGDTAANAFETDQKAVQDNAIGGQIIGIEIESNGEGYGSTTPTITLRGNGSAAAATATLSGGQVVKIEMNNESAGLGSGYDYAEVLFDGSPSKPAKARAIIGPREGLGKNSIEDLKASSIMLNIKPDGPVTVGDSATFIVGNSFRQISVLKGLREKDSAGGHIGGLFSGTSSRTTRAMLSASATSITIGRQISDTSSPPIRAYVDDVVGTRIFYHQNDSSGFGVFSDGATISDGINSISVDSANRLATVNPYSGDILYMENRAKVLRDASQQEDIKVILTV
jgi:hypothetical protein